MKVPELLVERVLLQEPSPVATVSGSGLRDMKLF